MNTQKIDEHALAITFRNYFRATWVIPKVSVGGIPSVPCFYPHIVKSNTRG